MKYFFHGPYVVLNPLRAGMVDERQDWHWSSYRAMAGLDASPEWLDNDWLLSQFGKYRKPAIKRYQQFVQEGISLLSPLHNVRHQLNSLSTMPTCKFLSPKTTLKQRSTFVRALSPRVTRLTTSKTGGKPCRIAFTHPAISSSWIECCRAWTDSLY